MSAEDAPRGTTLVSMPSLDQAQERGKVIEWHVVDGERVEKGARLVTVETDKATYEIEAPDSGPVHILVAAGEEVPVQTVLASIGERRPDATAAAAPPPGAAAPANSSDVAERPRAERQRVLAAPKARRIAAERGIDLATVAGSGPDGLITVEDVERAPTRASSAAAPAAGPGARRRVRERRTLQGVPRAAARRLQASWQAAPHIVQHIDVNATALRAAAEAERRRGSDGATLNDLILHAAAGVMARHADLNATLEDDTLVLYEGVDVGIAVDSPQGLLVPVVRDADARSLAELAAETRRLIAAARSGSVAPADMGAASLTVSNLGMFGIRAGTPVLNLGEPVLVFVGAIEERAVVVEGQVAAAPMLTLSIAYDHRIADGAAAAAFTRDLRAALEALAAGTAAAPAEVEPLPQRRLAAARSGEGAFRIDLRSGAHRWTLDEPFDVGGTDAGPTPVHAFLGALAACLAMSFQHTARRRNVPLDRVEAEARANPAGHIKEIDVTLRVWSPAEREVVDAMLAPAERGCYVRATLRGDLPCHTTLILEGPAPEA